jgi:hypothetical protein
MQLKSSDEFLHEGKVINMTRAVDALAASNTYL